MHMKMTELIDAIFSQDLSKLKVCLPDGRNVNVKIPGTEGCTPLHLVAGNDNGNKKEEMLTYLLELGADPNSRSFDDLTPVHLAAMWNNCWELEKLLQSGGNPWLTDNENKNSFDLAIDNQAYEANQLLHKYLSEDKLNFRDWVPKTESTPTSLDNSSNDNKGSSNYESENTGFCTANENFPLHFSTTDDEYSDYYLNVSKILKKNLTKTEPSPGKGQEDNQKNENQNKVPETKADVVLPYDSDTCNSSFDIKITKRRVDKSMCQNSTTSSSMSSDIFSTSENESIVYNFITAEQNPEIRQENNLKNENQNEVPVAKADVVLPYDSDTCNSSFDIQITKSRFDKPISQNPTASSSMSTDICSTSKIESKVNKSDSTVLDLELDEQSGITLLETSSSSFSYERRKKKRSYCVADCTWNCYNLNHNVFHLPDFCTYHNNYVLKVPDEYKLYSNSKIFQELKKRGDQPGPVSDSTREVYLRRLKRLESGCEPICALPVPRFCKELYQFVEGKMDADRCQNLINEMTEEFNNLDPDVKWREGNRRCCFNYFLLDPRVTQNLPSRVNGLSFDKIFLIFLEAIFYIGKGAKGRPYHHLVEASKETNYSKYYFMKSTKIGHIKDIWKRGFGVISLHCFHNCIPVEAYTQEACMIEAIGLDNLTNMDSGNYYGKSTKWKRSWKREVGVTLLHRALQIFLIEGERQIRPKDVKKR